MKEIMNQNEMEIIVNRTLDYEGSLDLSFDEFAKECEEEWETVPTKGTRHPSTRAERRKKTAHAKERKANTIRVREARKYPYSLMLGKGKRHDHVLVGERSIIESRTEEKLASELRDFVLCEESEWEWDLTEEKSAMWEGIESHKAGLDNWAGNLAQFHEKEINAFVEDELDKAYYMWLCHYEDDYEPAVIASVSREEFLAMWWLR